MIVFVQSLNRILAGAIRPMAKPIDASNIVENAVGLSLQGMRPMAKITSISEVSRSEDGGYPEVVELCEKLLAEAKAGQIESMAAMFVRPNRDVCTKVTASDNAHLNVAGAVYLLLDLVKAGK